MIEKSDASKKRVPYTDHELATIAKYFKNIKDSVTPSLKECRKFLASFPMRNKYRTELKTSSKADTLYYLFFCTYSLPFSHL